VKLYLWEIATPDMRRTIVVAADSEGEARSVVAHYAVRSQAEKPEDWRPGGRYYEALVRSPDVVQDIAEPIMLDSPP